MLEDAGGYGCAVEGTCGFWVSGLTMMMMMLRALRSLSRAQLLASRNKAPAQGTASAPPYYNYSTVRVVSDNQRWPPAIEGIQNAVKAMTT